jgi:hypothetical protein
MFEERRGFFMDMFEKCHKRIRSETYHKAARLDCIAVWAMRIGFFIASGMFVQGWICKKELERLTIAILALPAVYRACIQSHVYRAAGALSAAEAHKKMEGYLRALPAEMSMDDWADLYRLGNAVIWEDQEDVRMTLRDMESSPVFREWAFLRMVKRAFR